MRLLRHLAIDRSGSAAAEMAFVMPLLLILMFGCFELGKYFYNEHTLVKGVRDGARYAARQAFANYTTCSGDVPTPGAAGSVNENTKLIVRKGVIDTTADDLLPNWGSATFSATISCSTTAGGQDMRNGVYKGLTTGAPVVTVTATLPYMPLFNLMGFTGAGFSITASQQAAVSGL
jgi:Flp pilus assembly protein TadG